MVYLTFLGTKTANEVHCPKGEWTTVISTFATGTPASWKLEVEAQQENNIDGIYQEQRFFWVFPNSPTEGHLAPVLHVHRKWINARYILKIRPEHDVIVKIHKL